MYIAAQCGEFIVAHRLDDAGLRRGLRGNGDSSGQHGRYRHTKYTQSFQFKEVHRSTHLFRCQIRAEAFAWRRLKPPNAGPATMEFSLRDGTSPEDAACPIRLRFTPRGCSKKRATLHLMVVQNLGLSGAPARTVA